ncbi:MAG TPA: hypothetical protein VGG10_18450 [Rhizomicrobium sp.]|jgi:hypothetical protein
MTRHEAVTGRMEGDQPIQNGVGRRLSRIGKWWVGLIAALWLISTVIAAIVALYRFFTGNPEWEGIVMIPEILVFSVLLSLPGLVLLLLGRLIARHPS